MLPTNINDSGDADLDMSTLMAEHEMRASEDECILPTVPSLSDMMSQSEFCGSINSADSSPEDDMLAPFDVLSNGEVEPSLIIKQEVKT